MEIDVKRHGNVPVLHLSGKLTVGEPTERLRDTLKGLLEQGESRFVLDLLDVPWLDSAGIGEMVACFKRVKDRKGMFCAAAQGETNDLLKIYDMGKLFGLADNLKDALAKVKAPGR